MTNGDPVLRILIIGLNFSPELTGIGKYTGEMAKYLTGLGHDVHVVTAPPYYPAWRVGERYRWWRYVREHRGTIRVTRCPLWVPRSPSGWKRIVHLASFALTSLPAALAEVRWRPELVMSIAPAILATPNALLVAKLTGAKSWLHIHDFELEAAEQLGLISKLKPLAAIARIFERSAIRAFDHVSTLSPTMKNHLQELGVPEERLSLVANWVDTEVIRPVKRQRERFGLREQATVALYAGNLGRKQGLRVILEAARIVEHDQEILFVIAGEGSARVELEASARGQSNVRFLGLYPREQYVQLLSTADIHLLPERPEASGLVMPSKLGAMLASGRPVIVSAQRNSELGRVAGQAGLLVRAGDAKEIAEAVQSLAADPELRASIGRKGRAYAEVHLSKSEILDGLAVELSNLLDQGG